MSEPIINDYIELDEKELREFFNKYDREELELFDFIFYFAMSHNLIKPRKVLEEVYKEKKYEYSESEEVDIINKNNKLSYNELNYLYNLTDDGWMCTVNTREYFDYSDEGAELSRIKDSVYDEMQNRVKTNKNSLKLVP